MSSNDQVVIIKKDNLFEVHHDCCVDNDFEPDKESLLKVEDNLIDAIRYAAGFCNAWPYVEYGYMVDNSCLVKQKPIDKKFKYKCTCSWSKDDKYGMIPNTSCPVHGKRTKKMLKKTVPYKEAGK